MIAMPLDGWPQSKEKKERDGGIAHLGETRRRGRLGDGSVQMRGCEQQQSGGDGGKSSMASRAGSLSVLVEDAKWKRNARGLRSRA